MNLETSTRVRNKQGKHPAAAALSKGTYRHIDHFTIAIGYSTIMKTGLSAITNQKHLRVLLNVHNVCCPLLLGSFSIASASKLMAAAKLCSSSLTLDIQACGLP